MQMISPDTIASVIRQMSKFEFAQKKAKAIIDNLIGDRQVSKNKRKKLTRALLKQLCLTDDDATQIRIRKNLCFGCGYFTKPVEVTRFYWLCTSCELKYLGETKTSTKTVKN